jgi:hypothetical protein
MTYNLNACLEMYCGYRSEKRPLGGPRRRQEDNIKMDLRQIVCGDWASMETMWVPDQWQALELMLLNRRLLRIYNVFVPERLSITSRFQ